MSVTLARTRFFKLYCFNGLLIRYRKITSQYRGRFFLFFFQPFPTVLRTYMCRPWLMKTIELYVNAIQHPIEKPPIILTKSRSEWKTIQWKATKSQTWMFKRLSRLNAMSRLKNTKPISKNQTTDPKEKPTLEFDRSNIWKAKLQFFKIYFKWKANDPVPMKSISKLVWKAA